MNFLQIYCNKLLHHKNYCPAIYLVPFRTTSTALPANGKIKIRTIEESIASFAINIFCAEDFYRMRTIETSVLIPTYGYTYSDQPAFRNVKQDDKTEYSLYTNIL